MMMSRIHIWFPAALMIAIIAVTCVLTYGMPKGPWYQVIYFDGSSNAMLKSAAYADAIVADRENIATIYLKDKNNNAFEQSEAMIIDPTGVPLCLTSPSSVQKILAF